MHSAGANPGLFRMFPRGHRNSGQRGILPLELWKSSASRVPGPSQSRNPCSQVPAEHLNLMQSISKANCCRMVQFVVSAGFPDTFTNIQAIFQQSYPQSCGYRSAAGRRSRGPDRIRRLSATAAGVALPFHDNILPRITPTSIVVTIGSDRGDGDVPGSGGSIGVAAAAGLSRR
jgi:hypothetical protein